MGEKGLAGWTGQREPHCGIRLLVSRGTADGLERGRWLRTASDSSRVRPSWRGERTEAGGHVPERAEQRVEMNQGES